MHLFLLRKAGVSIGTDVAKHLGAAANVFVMRNPHETPAARLAAAERIVKTGAATTAELISVLDAQPVTPGAPANAAKLPFLAAQGALRRAALLESRPAVKAELVHEALVLGDKAAMFEISARLQADVVEKLDPAPVPENLRPLIGWALLLAGKPDAAARWIGEGDTARAVLALVSGKDGAPSDLSSIAVRVAGSDKAADPGRAFDALVLGIYNVLALPAPTDAKQVAASVEGRHWPGRRPANEAMQTILKAASAPDRKGEAVLRILEAVGADGPRDLAPDITIEFLRALEDMGLKDAAHALAIHAVLLYRPGTP
jgi:hypothetical protein